VTGWADQWFRWAWEGESWHFQIRPDLNTWIGVSGHLTISVGTRYVSAFDIQLKLWFGLTSTAYDAWKERVWGTLREAAQSRYDQHRTLLKDRLSQLQEELGAQDPLSLRKVEREEVMKHVLRWLFGPTFTFVPPGLPINLYGPNQAVIDDDTWAKVLAQGEMIKFLHQAIEWENMLFFLYPYFWSHTARWELKKYLEHPDFMHKSFLKSGSARVVLTIRPGFEKDFVSFLETGTFDGLSATHPYMTIAQEMQAFAETNYPGIRAANPIEHARPLLSPLEQKTWDEMQGIIKLLNQYKSNNGVYPTTAQGLNALAGLGTVPANDPWGNAYQYRSPGEYTDFELASLGADGVVGGDGENADIESWVEASLIGRWYEYTPTSAVDISFNETLPTA
jgi:type II secretion system (T2SS) protein G